MMRFVPFLMTVTLVTGCRHTALMPNRAPSPAPPTSKHSDEGAQLVPETTAVAAETDKSAPAASEDGGESLASAPSGPVDENSTQANGPDEPTEEVVREEPFVAPTEVPSGTAQPADPAATPEAEELTVEAVAAETDDDNAPREDRGEVSGHDELGPTQLVPEPPGTADAELLAGGETATEDPTADLEWQQPRLLRTEMVVGAAVTTLAGDRWGRIEDLLLDPKGAVAGVRTSRPLEDGTRLPGVVAYQPEGWRARDTDVEWVLAGADTAAGEPDFAELFETQEAETVEGEVIAIEVPDTAPVHAITLKMRDDNNVLHRALVDGAPLVLQRMPSVATGETLAIRALLTRDEVGKLWIATSVASQDESVEIRDAAGLVRWRQLADGFLSARALRGSSLETADGSSVVITDLLLDHERGAISALCIEVGGIDHLLDWQQITFDENGRRLTALTVSELSELPVPQPGLEAIVLSPSD